jgi:hypothetical protein
MAIATPMASAISCVEGDAAIAVRGDGDGDQLADFFAEE